MKYKREIRANTAARRWFILSGAGVLFLLASFYLDAAAQGWMGEHQNSGLRSFMEAVSHYGDWPSHIVLGCLLMGLAFWRGDRKWVRIFAAMILACALAGITTRVVKISTGRARPNVQTETRWHGALQFNPRYNAFPSGHTASSTGFFATLAFVSWRLGGALLAIPALIAFSRMYVGAHHLSDVVAAALLGTLVAYFVARRVIPQSETR